jgi:tetratricopeptide (TPR) repeat protein
MELALKAEQDAERRYSVAVGYYRQRLLMETINAVRQAVAIVPNNAKYQFLLGLALEEIGNVRDAQTAYQRAVELDPKHAGAWHNLGNCLKLLDRIPEAIVAYQHCIEIRPNDSFAYYSLGGVLERTADSERSILCYKKAVELNEDFTPALVALILRKLDHVEWQNLSVLTQKLYQAITNNRYPLSVSGFHRIWIHPKYTTSWRKPATLK